jgi:hypothetical protein
MNEPYWTLDTSLFEGTFRYFGRDPVQVRGKVHTEQERYQRSDINREITSIAVTQGTRVYLHMRPFVLIPDITLTIGLYRDPELGGAIGEVIKSQERRQKEVEIGNVQAWSYPDGTLVLWECFLHDFVRTLPLTADVNMLALWRGFETFLAQQFPQAIQIVTTSHDPMFEDDEYQEFLATLGYAKVSKAAWGKAIERSQPDNTQSMTT